MANTPVVEMKDISKSFGAVRALIDVDLTLYQNEILGLVGDNSAGKSTLMKILTGAYNADDGEIFFEGEPVHITNPHDSRELGIEMVYQDFALCGNLDIATNIYLGKWPRKQGFLGKWFVNVKHMEAESWKILQKLKVDADSVRLKVEGLSGGRQQSVAIGRVISFNPKVIILDEPTANLSVTATKQVLDLMLELKSTHDVAMIIISHRLQDIFAVGDRVMVLKRGRKVGERIITDTHEDDVLSMIVQGDAYEQSRQD
ncbi:ATP-binding cassette domain-containing protein [candidate division KSB3 bacterium]|uniref:ATP-binding cassette domain-containing protein n=1 Tax=candidate division KSB3 bacterium TaxID=2044937 RepID=A0A9D5JZ99_9BACT|nr:ATP-binding cassette domain-containing protein [candidate division KSB3 bacterium]MBD3326542.1 ATP-binding cassette domain-containing protein [candidate division KSB3 bacterium]